MATVRDEGTGGAIQGVEIGLYDEKGRPIESRHGEIRVTDSEGAAAWESLNGGDYSIHIRKTEYVSGCDPVAVTLVDDGTAHIGITVRGPDEIRGRVVNADGAGIGGATVALDWSCRPPRHLDWLHPKRETTSSEDGTFSIAVLPLDSSHRISVEAEGYVPRNLRDVPSDQHDLLVTLIPFGFISGRISDEAGASIAGATIVARPKEDPGSMRRGYRSFPTFRAETGPDGRYRVEDLEPNEYRLDAKRDGLGAQPILGVRVAAGEETTGVDFVLVPGFSISGRVIERGTGKTIPGIGVNASGESGHGSGVSDEKGVFVIQHLQPGKYRVTAWVDKPDRTKYTRAGTEWLEVEIVDSDVSGVDVDLARYAEVKGQILDSDGKPIPNVLIEYPGYGEGKTLTGEDGTFHLVHVYPTNQFSMSVKAEGAQRIRTRNMELESGETVSGYDVILPDFGKITGQVLTPGGEPVVNAQVRAQPIENTQENWTLLPYSYWGNGTSKVDGAYTIDNLIAGKYRIQASTEVAGRKSASEFRTEYLEAGETLENLDFTLEVPSLETTSLHGIVVDASGEPVPYCVVRLRESLRAGGILEARTNREGRFHFDEVAVGSHILSLMPPSPHPKLEGVEVTAPTGEVRLVLKETEPEEYPRPISGRVFDLETGDAIRDFQVFLTPLPERIMEGYERILPSRIGEGWFEFRDVPVRQPNAPWYLHIEAGGYTALERQLRPGRDGRWSDDYYLDPGGMVSGRVVSRESGEPAQGARVQIQCRRTLARTFHTRGRRMEEYSSETGPDGWFAVRHVLAGPARISVRHRDFGRWVSEITVGAGATTSVDVAMGPGGTVEGSVTDHDGNPLENVSVSLLGIVPSGWGRGRDSVASGQTDTDGRFAMNHVAPGDYLATARLKQGPTELSFVQVDEEKTTQLDIVVPLGSITGVVREDGAPARGWTVDAANGPGSAYASSKVADSDGGFHLAPVHAGSVTLGLAVKSGGYRRTTKRLVNVDPGETQHIEWEVPPGSISGTVVSATDGTPCPKARLRLHPVSDILERVEMRKIRQTGTDERGAFVFDHVPGDRYVVEAESRAYGGWSRSDAVPPIFGWGVKQIELEEGEKSEGLEISVGGNGSIEGKVLPPPGMTEKDVFGVAMLIAGGGPEAVPVRSSMVMFATGEFSTPNVPPGDYTVLAGYEEDAIMFRENVSVRDGETAHVELQWPEDPVTLTAVMADPDGKPVGNCAAYVTTRNGIPLLGIWEMEGIARDGVFHARLPRDEYLLHIEKPGYCPADVDLDLREVPETHELTVRLEEE